MKQLLCKQSGSVIAYFDPQTNVVLQCDASQKGLGAALLQERRPVSYTSRCMTNAEQNYALIEKELLVKVFACERFHQCTHGRDITVESDHKPTKQTTSLYPTTATENAAWGFFHSTSNPRYPHDARVSHGAHLRLRKVTCAVVDKQTFEVHPVCNTQIIATCPRKPGSHSPPLQGEAKEIKEVLRSILQNSIVHLCRSPSTTGKNGGGYQPAIVTEKANTPRS